MASSMGQPNKPVSNDDVGAAPVAIVYEKNVSDGEWKDYKWNYDVGNSPFFHAWKKKFNHLKLSLEKREAPDDEELYVSIKGGDGNSVWFAILDAQDDHRAFIGEAIMWGCTEYAVSGGICYFDEHGKMESSKVFDQELFRHDSRRGPCPDADSMYFCGDTIGYVSSYGGMDSDNKMHGWFLKDDCLVGHFNELGSWYKGDAERLGQKNNWKIINGRWYCSIRPTSNWKSQYWPRQYSCVDLKSIRSVDINKARKGTLYDTLLVPATMDPKIAIESLVDVPSYGITERDGYPVTCINCGQDTCQGRIYLNQERLGGGLGLACCPSCLIRYSKWGNNWICWKVVSTPSGELKECNCVVGPPSYKCTGNHTDTNMKVTETTKKRNHARQSIVEVRCEVKEQETDVSE